MEKIQNIFHSGLIMQRCPYIILYILKTVSKERTAAKRYMTDHTCMRLSQVLASEGFIILDPKKTGRKKYMRLTEKGVQLLEYMQKIDRLLSEKI